MDNKVNQGSQALMRGLEILKVVSESPNPLSSSEIARRVGLHPSWTSRILRTLIGAGYIRKQSYRSFGVNYGIICLGGLSSEQFTFAKKPLAGLTRLIRSIENFEITLGCLWDTQIIYFMRIHHSLGYSPPSAGFFVPHKSAIAMRIILEIDKEEAIKILEASQKRYTWVPSEYNTTDTPEICLSRARKHLHNGCLFHEDEERNCIGGAIIVKVTGEPLAALSLSGPIRSCSKERLAMALYEGKNIVESSMSYTI